MLRVSGGVIASSGKLMCVPRKLANVEGGGQLPSVDHLRVLGRPTQGVWSVTVIAREMMCMTIKLANISREGVSYPSVGYLRVLGRPAQGVWPVKVRARDFDVYD